MPHREVVTHDITLRSSTALNCLIESEYLMRGLPWRNILWGLFAIIVIVGIIYREPIVFNLKLLNVARIGKAYYSEYPFITKNIAYGAAPHQKLDVYRPEKPGNYPVVIYIYGGSWNSGDKELYALVAQKLVPLGMVVVVPTYKLYPDATYPIMIDDVAAAVSWTIANIDQYSGNPKRIILGGQSAGAQLSAMAFMNPAVLGKFQHSSAELCGYYGISGVYDINAQYAFEQAHGRTAPVMTAVMGGQANFTATSPTSYIRADLPPMLIIHGDADETVPLSMSQDFVTALKQAGVTADLHVYPGRGHSELLFYTLTQNPGQLITDVVDFANQCP